MEDEPDEHRTPEKLEVVEPGVLEENWTFDMGDQAAKAKGELEHIAPAGNPHFPVAAVHGGVDVAADKVVINRHWL
jgi:hypothetical protein